MAKEPIYELVDKVVAAIQEYDRARDHIKGHFGTDCIRCKLVASLPPSAQKQVAERNVA